MDWTDRKLVQRHAREIKLWKYQSEPLNTSIEKAILKHYWINEQWIFKESQYIICSV